MPKSRRRGELGQMTLDRLLTLYILSRPQSFFFCAYRFPCIPGLEVGLGKHVKIITSRDLPLSATAFLA